MQEQNKTAREADGRKEREEYNNLYIFECTAGCVCLGMAFAIH